MSDKPKSPSDPSFADLVGEVKPLRSPPVTAPPRKPTASARFRRADDAAVLTESLDAHPDDIDGADQLRYRQPKLREAALRDLKRGRYAVQGEMDLHGLTVPEAREALDEFLIESVQHLHRCVRVIHGKGKGSRQGQPVLKPKVARWLRQRSIVLGFCSARQVDGGTGALYVLLDV